MYRPFIKSTCLLLCLLLLNACSLFTSKEEQAVTIIADPGSTRQLSQGIVVGYKGPNNSHSWQGIPFAQPPVAELRWRAPRKAQSWPGTRQALSPAASCAQFGAKNGKISTSRWDHFQGSEDCLYLNIWAPQLAPSNLPQGPERLPVMVWIHGGGNTVGSGAKYDYSQLATQENLIVITINYRLGVFGWFSHPALNASYDNSLDRSGNYGTLDIIQSLRWVKENIAAFGGDPDQVTVFGESAGASNVITLLASPTAQGLFQRAIAQSGNVRSFSTREAQNYSDHIDAGHSNSSREVVNTLLQASGLAKTRKLAKLTQSSMPDAKIADFLRSKNTLEILSAFKPGFGGMYGLPLVIRDGDVIPLDPIPTLFRDTASYNSVPTLLGSNRDEQKLFMILDPEYVDRFFNVFMRARDPAAYERDARYISESWRAAAVDELAQQMRESQGPSVYAYRFDWDDESSNFLVDFKALLGAAHGLEISFITGDFEGGLAIPFVFTKDNQAARQTLSKQMMSYWAEFARHGAPGKGSAGKLPTWSPWSNGISDNKFMILDTPADGGLQMSGQQIRMTDIVSRLRLDGSFSHAKDRCQLYSTMFRDSPYWQADDYRSMAQPGCR